MTSVKTMPERGTTHDIDYIATDSGNADRLVREHGKDFRYCDALGGWLHWTGIRWSVDNSAIWKRARQVGKVIQHEAAETTNSNDGDRLWQHGRYTLSEPGLRRMISLASRDAAVRVGPGLFDSDPYLLNCLNGTMDIRSGQVRDHDRGDLITKLAPVAYDPHADSGEWDAFLDRVIPDQDLRDFLRISVGYSAIGNAAEHVMFILYGLGANGKSTFTETLKHVLGDYAHRTNSNALVNGGKASNGPAPDGPCELEGP